MKPYIQLNNILFLSSLFLTLSIHSGIGMSRPAQAMVRSSHVSPETFEPDESSTYHTLKLMIAANIQTFNDLDKDVIKDIKEKEAKIKEESCEITVEDKKFLALHGINRLVSGIDLILENLKEKKKSLCRSDRRKNEIIILLDWAKDFFKEKKRNFLNLQSEWGIWPESVLMSPRRNST
jgi:hypothetical protein